MSAKFLVDIWLGWTIFTYIVVILWGLATVVHYLGRTNIFDLKGTVYRVLLTATTLLAFIMFMAYSIPLRGKAFDLLYDIRDALYSGKYNSDIPKDFTNPTKLANWIDQRSYYAGQNTLIIYTIWLIIALIYSFHTLCCEERPETNSGYNKDEDFA